MNCIRCERERKTYDDPTHVCRRCYDEKFGYKPNSISLTVRVRNISISLFLIGYSLWCFWSEKLYLILIGKRGNGGVYELSDLGLILGIVSFALFIASMSAVVVDHYDRRNNERMYSLISNICLLVGGVIYLVAILLFSKRV